MWGLLNVRQVKNVPGRRRAAKLAPAAVHRGRCSPASPDVGGYLL